MRAQSGSLAPMAPLPPVPNVLRILHKGTYQGAPWLVGIHVRYTGARPNSGQIDAACGSIASAWNTHLALLHATTVSLQRVEGYDLSAPDAANGFTSTSYTGTKSGTPQPVSLAAVMSMKVNYRWRGGHIRSYWPASVGGDLQSGRLWASSFKTSMDTQFNAWFAAINQITFGGATLKLVGVRYQGKNDPSTFPKDLDVISVVAHSRADTQRRRLGKEIV